MMRAILLLLASAATLPAGVVVTFGAEQANDGFSWDYKLTVYNQCSDCPISGLIVLKGDTVFALQAASEITPPDDWSYMWPVPGVVDELTFSSNKPEADIKKGSSLDFTFNSITPPEGLKPADLLVDVICRDTGAQAPAKGVLIPEPNSALLAVGALLAWMASSTRKRRV